MWTLSPKHSWFPFNTRVLAKWHQRASWRVQTLSRCQPSTPTEVNQEIQVCGFVLNHQSGHLHPLREQWSYLMFSLYRENKLCVGRWGWEWFLRGNPWEELSQARTQSFLMAYSVPGSILGAEPKGYWKTVLTFKTMIPLLWSHLIWITALRGSSYSYHHWTDEETETWRFKRLTQCLSLRKLKAKAGLRHSATDWILFTTLFSPTKPKSRLGYPFSTPSRSWSSFPRCFSHIPWSPPITARVALKGSHLCLLLR